MNPDVGHVDIADADPGEQNRNFVLRRAVKMLLLVGDSGSLEVLTIGDQEKRCVVFRMPNGFTRTGAT